MIRSARVQMPSRSGNLIYCPDGAERQVRNAIMRGKTADNDQAHHRQYLHDRNDNPVRATEKNSR